MVKNKIAPPFRIAEFDIWLQGLAYTGKGRGTQAIKLLAERLFGDGYKKIIIRPSIKNIPAIKSYGKAGFVEEKLVVGDYYKPEFVELYGDGDYGEGGDVFMVLENEK